MTLVETENYITLTRWHHLSVKVSLIKNISIKYALNRTNMVIGLHKHDHIVNLNSFTSVISGYRYIR